MLKACPILLLLVVFAVSACAVRTQIVGGSEDAVSVSAEPWTNVDRFAERYCQGYGKRAEFLGDKPLGPSTTKRLYAYNCVSPAEPHG